MREIYGIVWVHPDQLDSFNPEEIEVTPGFNSLNDTLQYCVRKSGYEMIPRPVQLFVGELV